MLARITPGEIWEQCADGSGRPYKWFTTSEGQDGSFRALVYCIIGVKTPAKKLRKTFS